MKNKTVIINTEEGKKKYTIKEGQEMITPLDREFIFHASNRLALDANERAVMHLLEGSREEENKEYYNRPLIGCLCAMGEGLHKTLTVCILKMHLRLFEVCPELEGREITFTQKADLMKIGDKDKMWTIDYLTEELKIITDESEMLSGIQSMTISQKEKNKLCKGVEKATKVAIKIHRTKGRKMNGQKGELDIDELKDAMGDANDILTMLKEGEGGIA